jgi:rod shape-determining protein MreD
MTLQGWGRLVVVVSLAVVIQTGLLDQLVIGGAHPDIFVLLAVVAGLAAGPQRGAVAAFSIGLVADLFVQTPFGLSSLCYVLLAFVTGLAAGLPSGRAPYSFRVAAGFIGSVGGTLLFAGLVTLIGQPALPRQQLVIVTAVVALTNAVLAIPAAASMTWAVTAGPGAQRELAGVSGGSAR